MIDVAVIADADLPGDIRDALRTMLHDAFDSEFSDADWHHTCGGWRAVVFEDGMPVSHASVVERAITVDGRGLRAGYVEGVATAARRRGEGLGRAVLAAATDVVQARFEIGVLSTGVPRFYEVLGWVRWSGPSYVQDGDALVRTAEEDDGLMVLRFGPSAALDLSAAIACECRAGDDW